MILIDNDRACSSKENIYKEKSDNLSLEKKEIAGAHMRGFTPVQKSI